MDRKTKRWHCGAWLLLIAGCGKAEATGTALSVTTCAQLPAETPFSSECPNVRCGNGRIDACNRNGPQEVCDGTQLGGATCAMQGYRGGSMRCNSICQLDVRGCDTCAADPRVTACHHLPVSAPTSSGLSLATNPSEIAVAWSEGVLPGMSAWHFTRFRPDGTMLSDRPCVGSTAAGVSLIAMSSGWLVAAVTSSGSVDLTRLDTGGAVSWTKHTGTQNPVGAQTPLWFSTPRLIAGPGGPPLLTWIEFVPGQDFGGTLHLDALDAEGEPTGSGVVIPDVSGSVGTGVDDGFAIAAQVSADTPQSVLQLFHLSLDGTLAAGGSVPRQTNVAPLSLVWSGSELRLLYQVGDGSVPTATYLWRANADGSLIGFAQVVGSGSLETASAVVLGGDTLVLRDQTLEGWTDNGPSPQWPALQVIYARAFYAELAVQGGDAILAWIDIATPLSLERVHMAP